MGFIQLQIEEPQHNAAFIGSGPASFNGSALVPLALQDVPLYFRWYASSFSNIINTPDPVVFNYSMNEPALRTPEYSPPVGPPDLGIGSHVITFAVSDVAGEKEPAFSTIKHAGVTGGEKGEHPCIIHVFKANIIEPIAGQQVSREKLILKAEAPPLWDKQEYQDINRLGYRWILKPVGKPARRPSADTGKLGTQLKFEKSTATTPASLAYEFSTSNMKFAGDYRITLHVLDATNANIGVHIDTVTVVF